MGRTSHQKAGPGAAGGPPLPTQGAAVKKSKIKIIKHKNNWWKIKTRKKHSGSGLDYQNSEDKTEGKYESVGNFASCASGRTIKTESECRKAAGDLNLFLGTPTFAAGWAGHQRGCIATNNVVYFNHDNIVAPSSDGRYRAICVKGTTTTTTTKTEKQPKTTTNSDCSSNIHGSVGFAIDTTASMAKALPMVKEMILKLVESRSKIPTWVLTSFNDPAVSLVKKTNKVKDLRSSLNKLEYGGGGDLEEEAFQGIEVTLDNMPDNGVILVVTDAGTKKKELEKSKKKKSAKKNIKIFIAFSPKCMAAKFCSESMPGYNRVSEGRIFNQTDFDTEKFFNSVLYT